MKCYGLKEIIRAKDNKLYNVERDKKKKTWMDELFWQNDTQSLKIKTEL